MMIWRETDMLPIKKKMTQIRRAGNSPILHNYYLNCENSQELLALYGENTVVFWHDDGGLIRAYFYSCDKKELAELLSEVPQNAVIDYLTRHSDAHKEMFENAGWKHLSKMQRMVEKISTPQDAMIAEKKRAALDAAFYREDKVKVADESDLDTVYNKLFEVFDVRESHLCTKEELLQFIRNRWVSVYYDGGQLMGIHIFKIQNNSFYGYQLWSGSGTESCYSVVRRSDITYAEIRSKEEEQAGGFPAGTTQRPRFGWVNSENKKAIRWAEIRGNQFDGLFDDVYQKQTTGAELPEMKEKNDRSCEGNCEKHN